MNNKLWPVVAGVAGIAIGANWDRIKKYSAPWTRGTAKSIAKATRGTGRCLANGWCATSGAVMGLFGAKKKKVPVAVHRGRPARRTVPVTA